MKGTRTRILEACVFALVVLCGSGHAAELTVVGTPSFVREVAPSEAKAPAEPDMPAREQFFDLEKAIAAARTDLQGQSGQADFTLREAMTVTWPDSSCGCASPGTGYMQVLTPGYLIVFEHGQELIRYTGSQRSAPRRCPASQFRPPVATSPDV